MINVTRDGVRCVTMGDVDFDAARGSRGLTHGRAFCQVGDPYATVQWEWSDVQIRDDAGLVVFSERCEFPAVWSSRAREIVASKYFYGSHEEGFRESSLRQLVGRVTGTIVQWGIDQGYFDGPEDARNFYADLAWLQIHQHFAFNSPVYFNVGLHHYGVKADPEGYHWRHWCDPEADLLADPAEPMPDVYPCDDPIKHPQISACFIQSVQDNMASIMALATSEAILFKRGSGTGTDLSTLRSFRERLTGGGRPSGPVSFMRVYDSVAAIVKSGGKKRRAAKMQSLKYNHPDIFEFVRAKRDQEDVVRALKAAGYSSDFNGGAYDNAYFQNCNMSVRVNRDFMDAARESRDLHAIAVTTREPISTFNAGALLREIGECAHDCGDPGLQFDDEINRWNTVPNFARINASNPCGEYNFVDNSACNLASHNLLKYLGHDGKFSFNSFHVACMIAATAQDIMVDPASYPTEAIARNSHRLRPLGGGYANLGALLMARGIPYDSDEGRSIAALITSILTASYYLRSAQIAENLGAFAEFADNRESMLRVVALHHDHARNVALPMINSVHYRDMYDFIDILWDDVFKRGQSNGYRNAQATCIAPTGTIAFMMDCDTLGIEPEIALLRTKKLAGGGVMSLANESVPRALRALGYPDDQISETIDHLKRFGTLESVRLSIEDDAVPSPIDAEHLPVFDCSFPASMSDTGRCLRPEAHVLMVAACTPFVSGAISKTCNLPRDATVNDVIDIYNMAWKTGCKSITVYRDGSKEDQPVRAVAPKRENSVSSTNGHVYVKDIHWKDFPDETTMAVHGDWTSQATRDQLIEHIKDLERDVSSLRLHNTRKDLAATRALADAQSEHPAANDVVVVDVPILAPKRERLPETRRSLTHKFNIVGHEGYIHVGFYDDGRPGEVFVSMAKEGSTLAGLLDWIGIQTSIMLQYGVPLEHVVRKASGMHFQPYGATTNKRDLPFVKSIIDYIYRWLGCEFIPGYRDHQSPRRGDDQTPARSHGPDSMQIETIGTESERSDSYRTFPIRHTGNICPTCGAMTIRQGACEQCFNCGWSDGGCGG